VCRKVAAKVASDEIKSATITVQKLPEYLGKRRVFKESLSKRPKVGTAVGLAWTPVGGDILGIEATRMPGNGRFKVTGQLGDVMKESVEIALSYIKHNHKRFDVDTGIFTKEDLHIHFPAGAVPKDGPSAGVTITTALISLLSGKRGTRPTARLAMTGEMTLSGSVLPVGGIREKVLAAQAAGVQSIVLPKRNQRDVDEIPPHTIKGLNFIYADTYEDVYGAAIAKPISSK
jgi:ATP-dependent Lon protease